MRLDRSVSLKEAIKFHGHLGPYLILGMLAGDLALKKLRCRKYFGLKVKVSGANIKPKSCLIDGLQLSTGATYGKGNMQKIKAKTIQILFQTIKENKRLKIRLNDETIKKLEKLKGHKDSKSFAKLLYKISPLKIFDLTPKT
jgi:formylmethanofuran dehydrogenase subunit E